MLLEANIMSGNQTVLSACIRALCGVVQNVTQEHVRVLGLLKKSYAFCMNTLANPDKLYTVKGMEISAVRAVLIIGLIVKNYEIDNE